MIPTNRNKANASSSQTKTPARTLIRVRNNQRRHRERRRQYIASLEAKVLETERRLTQALADVASLRGQVESSDLRTNEIKPVSDNVLGAGANPPAETGQERGRNTFELQETSLIPQRFKTYAPEIPTASQGLPGPQLIRNDLPVTDPSNLPAARSFGRPDPSALRHTEDSSDEHQLAFSPQCCLAAEEPPKAIPAPLDAMIPPLSTPEFEDSVLQSSLCGDYPPPTGQSTTACVQAYIFISQLNFRGLDSDAITNWLHPGFRRPTLPNEGCQVDSALLFELLDFISDA